MLNDIKTKLCELNLPVFYCQVDKSISEQDWNYIVYFRDNSVFDKTKREYKQYFTVAVISENYIAEGIDLTIIEKLTGLQGVRLVSEKINYTYKTKPNTDIVVEILTLTFVKVKKI